MTVSEKIAKVNDAMRGYGNMVGIFKLWTEV